MQSASDLLAFIICHESWSDFLQQVIESSEVIQNFLLYEFTAVDISFAVHTAPSYHDMRHLAKSFLTNMDTQSKVPRHRYELKWIILQR